MTTIDTTELVHLPLDQLNDHPDNLRADVGDLTELVASIHALGIIEPLVVTPDGALFTVLAGHRRLAAAEAAGLAAVPCVVREDVDDQQAAEIMLVENLQRAGLNPIEEGTGFARLAALGLTQREIAERVGCNQSHVSKRIKLTTLPEVARRWLAEGLLLVDDALELAKLEGDSLDAAIAELVAMREAWAKAGSGDSAFAGYNVDTAMKRVIARQRHADALAEAKASKLKRLDRRPYKGAGDFEPCKKAEATHWFVEDGQATVIWARKFERSVPTTKPDVAPGSPAEAVMAAAKSAANEAIADRRERRRETLDAAAGSDPFVLFRFACSAAMSNLREIGELYATPEVGLNLPESAHVALPVLLLDYYGERAAECIAWEEELDQGHRSTYDALVELGYELDDDERAALPGLDAAAELAEEVAPPASAWDDVVDPPGVDELRAADVEAGAQQCRICGCTDNVACIPPCSWAEPDVCSTCAAADPATPEEAEAAARAHDTDPFVEWAGDQLATLQTTAPWKAYPFTRPEVKLVGNIREHKGIDKLRHAVIWERANDARPLVLAALAERIAELES